MHGPASGSVRAGGIRALRRCAGLALATALSVAGLAAPVPAAERTRLVAYTALEVEQLDPIRRAVEAAVPEVEIAWLRASTGIVTDRMLAERDAPQADLLLGIAATSLLQFEAAGLLDPYRPAGVEALRPFFRDPTPPYSWTGMDAYLGVICFNVEVAGRHRITRPNFWRDLIGPGFKGRVVMPNPASSGTGYLLVAAWLQTLGEEAGWAFMDALHENVAAYLPSGSGPCREAAAGRQAAGLSLDMRAAAEKAAGAPIDIVVPVDGTGWEAEAFAVVAGRPHLALARRVADWAASREANALYARSYAIVAYPGVATPGPVYPPHAEARMIRNDLDWMARNRARILAEWTRRYGAKVLREP
ncbi:putative 2-aminoethylphosphonate ABC transporter substrate-binding protein [Methylobacterium terrae]|uniref:Putative 2-aminoethylphosphonate ABC transporter substrate-binding protein n=1 Tax=Methylobacterium terrae TaxID=2202827 RepID=A0A2U8WM17_9HYPH|nr:extracellular solute-binding protein [Methylobacterium terrae]AWN47294.1 putative 2-aminoethylphosphonate ABC transporter substrate-binding protein [Methylobacterium terrae]